MGHEEAHMAYEETKMPYREKTAWLSLIAMAVTFGPYFAIVAAGVLPNEALPNLRQLVFYGVAAIAQVIILGIGRFFLHIASPQEARTPADERDRAIERRSINAAYFVLLAGAIGAGVIMPFTYGGWAIVNASLFAIAAAEVVHHAVVVVSYRRQA
jgi:hypothetical protein